MKIQLRFKGGAGSGNFGHQGRPGEVGGSSSGGSGIVVPSFGDIERRAGGNSGIAYVVHGAIKGSKAGKDPAAAFVDSVENENYYGNRSDVVRDRKKAWKVFTDYMKGFGVKVNSRAYDKYEAAQFDEGD
jgi:hypothetical protein